MSMLKNFSVWVLSLPLMGCTTVPTTTHDARLNDYAKKIKTIDFEYNPYDTPIAQCYAQQLNVRKEQ